MKQKILPVLTALVLALSLLPVSALAAGNPPAGTEETNYVTLELI